MPEQRIERKGGWYDLSPEEFLEAIRNLHKEDIKDVPFDTFPSRIRSLVDEHIIEQSQADITLQHLESLKPKRHNSKK